MARRRKSIFGRRKSRKKKNKSLKLEVESTILREIWAVIHLSLAVFTYLSLSNNFGLVGEIWVGILQPILGWGVQVLPIIFLAVALMLFFSKKVQFPLSRLMGIFLLSGAILSILHLYVPMDSLMSEAQMGNYGGYVGFVMNFLFREVLAIGHIGAFAVFAMILVIGFLLTFEISIGAFLSFFKPQIKIVKKAGEKKARAMKEDDDEEEEEEEEEEVDKEDYSEEDFKRERFKHLGDDSLEMLTIKRPTISSSTDTPKEKQIQITEGEDHTEALQTNDDEYTWEPFGLELLHPPVPDAAMDDSYLQENARKIRDKLKQFGINVEMHEVHVGPTVIQYTLRPDEGIKLSKITTLKNDLALALAAKAIRIEAPIPGKSLVGIEVPNDKRSIVHLRELLESKEFMGIDSLLRVPLGRNVSGMAICDDIATMPHCLVAGATGSGKSVFMNGILLSLLYQNSPADLKMILVDPKRVELNAYDGIPHLLTPVVTDPEKAAIALRWVVAEMNRRYILLSEKKFKNIKEYNEAVKQQMSKVPESQDEEQLQKMPQIIVVIDELADLMMAAGKEVEASICRIAQMARAVGIHLIIATQRPSVDVITGLIKANIPTRIAFAVSSSIDSRTILDGVGAEDLLGQGDMLYLPEGISKPSRVQGVFVSSKEIEKVTNQIKIMSPPSYIDDVISPKLTKEKVQGIPTSKLNVEDEDGDDLYQQALEIILESRKASASLLQRRLKVGYARAARLLDLMEENGVIGPVNGSKPREIYID